MFLDGYRVVCTSLISKIICNHHTLRATNLADARNNICTRYTLLCPQGVVACQLPNFKERRTRVQDSIDALPGQELVPLMRNLTLPLANVHRFMHDLIQLLIKEHHLLVIA